MLCCFYTEVMRKYHFALLFSWHIYRNNSLPGSLIYIRLSLLLASAAVTASIPFLPHRLTRPSPPACANLPPSFWRNSPLFDRDFVRGIIDLVESMLARANPRWSSQSVMEINRALSVRLAVRRLVVSLSRRSVLFCLIALRRGIFKTVAFVGLCRLLVAWVKSSLGIYGTALFLMTVLEQFLPNLGVRSADSEEDVSDDESLSESAIAIRGLRLSATTVWKAHIVRLRWFQIFGIIGEHTMF